MMSCKKKKSFDIINRMKSKLLYHEIAVSYFITGINYIFGCARITIVSLVLLKMVIFTVNNCC